MINSLSLAANDGLLTTNQKDFLTRTVLVVSCLDAGKREVFRSLVSDMLEKRDQKKFKEDLYLVRKYLSTLRLHNEILKEMDQLFDLK